MKFPLRKLAYIDKHGERIGSRRFKDYLSHCIKVSDADLLLLTSEEADVLNKSIKEHSDYYEKRNAPAPSIIVEFNSGFRYRKEKKVFKPKLKVLKEKSKNTKELTPGQVSTKYRDKCTTFNQLYRKKHGLPRDIHVDHIVPVSLCRKMGITPEQACVERNMTFCSKEDNEKKWSFVDGNVLAHLKMLCKDVWGIPMPSEDFIAEHNRVASSSYKSFNKKLRAV